MDVYSRPEKFGIKIVGEVDWADGYDYDKYVVWKCPDGTFRAARSSGCSCASPFEGKGLSDLDEVTPAQVLEAMNKYNDQLDPDSYSRRDQAIAELFDRMVRP